MTHSNTRIYLHIVWSTKKRRNILEGDLEVFVHGRLRDAAEERGLSVLALNSAWDHTHGLFRWNKNLVISNTVGELKSSAASGWLARCKKSGEESRLKWQRGYSSWSVGPGQIGRVVDYIADQKKLHRGGDARDDWEA